MRRGPRTLCSIQVQNPGTSGGSSTVTTDGVTIQGNGSGGSPIALKAVETDSSLSGAGIVGNTLKVTPMTFWAAASASVSGFGNTSANMLFISSIEIPAPLTFAHIIAQASTGDGANNSDIGLYNISGTLIANIGAQLISVTTAVSYATLQGAQTIPQGSYLVAMTSVGTTLKLFGANSYYVQYHSAAYGSSSGGALPASITPPTLSIAASNLGLYFF
jgi:hypothetical protein